LHRQNRGPIAPTLEIGLCSAEFTALDGGPSSRLTLKLRGARASQHDQALAELRSYADSLFFQIDLMYGSTFILERERRLRFSPPRRSPNPGLAYPIAQYNDEAMSLYWYAKSAPDMPLLRFLAFYQSIEFYFPRYSQTEARKRVGTIIKHPTFRPHHDDDLDRLISAIRLARSGGLGSERSQLRAVVTECVSADEIRKYLTGFKEREEHFSGKGQKGSYVKIPISNKTADLRNDVADRIYDIRRKIVHTKSEHSEDFSEDADYLAHDIELVEFVARSVLISSSDALPPAGADGFRHVLGPDELRGALEALHEESSTTRVFTYREPVLPPDGHREDDLAPLDRTDANRRLDLTMSAWFSPWRLQCSASGRQAVLVKLRGERGEWPIRRRWVRIGATTSSTPSSPTISPCFRSSALGSPT
jgi:hypothetical protein